MTMLTPWVPERGEAIVQAALREWERGVQEPPLGRASDVRVYLRACGFGAAEAYSANGDAEWCGAFAGWCALQAGADPSVVRVKPDPEAGDFASTYRLMRLARANPARYIKRAADLRPGDVAVVGRVGRRAWGEHVVLVETPLTAGLIGTIEGNASGRLGAGRGNGEGVVRRSRLEVPTVSVRGFLFGVRLTPSDYIREV